MKRLKELTKNKPQGNRVYDPTGVAVTLSSGGGGMGAKTGLYAVRPCLTLTAQDKHGVLLDDGRKVRVRKLTPKECFRLQGFPDEYYERAAQVCSDSQLYKQAGNSVTVNVIYEIAKRLEVKK